MVKFTRTERNAVCKASDNGPSISVWLDRINAINNPALTEAVDAIWCGREGRETIPMPGTNAMLCVGWYNSRVEYSYIS